MAKENLYFIAIIPSKEISDEVIAFKQDMADRFDSRAALKVLPHITLKAPFKLADEQHEGLLQWFNALDVERKPFDIELKDFGTFANKKSPVIFVHPLMNPAFQALQKEIISSFRKAYPAIVMMAPDWKFNPHMTIAYRDLSEELYPEAWNEYQHKQYSATIHTDSFHLLQHDRRKWNVLASYSLQ